ncbi:Helix-turn-helix [Clostridium cavendishii DSM 21758]|uniref:Helix-turn-helix n=1 Tax=Clostridium cavendishii DSM 21758 TaxID=1121302 RepID=A0A1M6W5I2_9CLOT|nr:helix-turn-helix transcriptional regulator [Clostridium cavendishii]SHK89014.1 Helix-turn-helix [Clostridium cavendishii DSM 21758]
MFYNQSTTYSYKKTITWNVLLINIKAYDKYILHSGLKPKIVGEWIKYHRKLNECSQVELALKLGFKETTARNIISYYESNIVKPNKETSMKLARLFNLQSKYFYDSYFGFLDNAPSILKKYRESNNLSLTEAANRIGTTYNTWSRWEMGKPISRKYFNKLKEFEVL